jgi:hypothetical protein
MSSHREKRRGEENGACHMGQAKQQYMVDKTANKGHVRDKAKHQPKSFVTDRPGASRLHAAMRGRINTGQLGMVLARLPANAFMLPVHSSVKTGTTPAVVSQCYQR